MNVPKLRFKEFNESYNIKEINEITYNVASGKISKPVEDGNYNIYGSMGKIGTSNFYDYEGEKVLVARVGANAGSVNKINEKCCISDNTLVLEPKDVLNDYLYYSLKHYNPQKLIFGSGQPLVTGGQLKKIKLGIPGEKEQLKVANFLSLLDKKIELQTKKIEDLKLFKKGLIKKIFSSDNLSEVQIKDLGTIITGTTPSKENKNYWDNGTIAWVTPTDINYERDISNSITLLTKEGLEKGRFVPKNSILVTCIASIGKNAVIKVDGSCNQQINAIIPNNNYNSNYIYYLMEYISPYLQSIAGTSATAIVNKETFERVKVKVHKIEEQVNIDKMLSSIESKILLENNLLNKLSELKKGLMQNMFV